MKAIAYAKYGSPDVLEMIEVPKPVPNNNEVLIKTYATTVNSADWRARSLELPPGFNPIGRLAFGIWGPRNPVLGTELAGKIVSLGDNVTKFKIGDDVFADMGASFGAHAEYVARHEDSAIALKPENASFEEAAAISFGGTAALSFLRDKGNIKRGDKILVNGASGTVGLACVQLAKHFGAHVTGVCSTNNLQLVRDVGADDVIDYTVEDFTNNGQTYDIIVDTAGTAPWSRAKASLNDTGRLLLVLGGLSDMVRGPFVSRKHGKQLLPGVAIGRAEDLQFLGELVTAGSFKPVIDRIFRFEEMKEAHAYVDTGRKKGSVAITLNHETI